MPIPEPVQLELAKAVGVLAAHSAEIAVAVFTGLPPLVAALFASRRAGKAVKKAQEAVDVTRAGNAKLDAVHEDVKNLPATPSAVVVPVTVQTPQAPTEPQ